MCSDLNCTTPLPDQRNLTGTTSGGEEFCQKGIARAGVKYLLDREKILEKCALKGGTSATCLAGTFDPTVPLKLETAVTHKDTTIKKLCGNRDPLPSPPFCCRTGTGSSCTVATDSSAVKKVLHGLIGGGVGGLLGGVLYVLFVLLLDKVFGGKVDLDKLWSPSAFGFVALSTYQITPLVKVMA